MRFEKWQALGNDYLILEREQLAFELTAARVRRLCAGHFGVFADGVLLLSRSTDPRLVADLLIYNPDGSQAELSGNGAREAILYLRRNGWTDQDSFAIGTAAGEIRPRIIGADRCRVDMGRASLTSKDFPGGPPDGRGELAAGEPAGAQRPADLHSWRFQHVSIGNPQCAIHVADEAALESLDLPAIGPAIEGHAAFPNRTNVSWYTEVDPYSVAQESAELSALHKSADPSSEPDASEFLTEPPVGRIRARIFERGVGETLSSGTGATGAAIAYALEAGAPPRRVLVQLDGGELEVEVGENLQVHLTGWARPVFEGRLSDDFLKELHATE
jgi:diaminopimelate epimerase